jgi:putative ribosome biogenesis GTPase RsgA
MNEPGCAVLEALENGLINPERYRSYLSMRSGVLEE